MSEWVATNRFRWLKTNEANDPAIYTGQGYFKQPLQLQQLFVFEPLYSEVMKSTQPRTLGFKIEQWRPIEIEIE